MKGISRNSMYRLKIALGGKNSKNIQIPMAIDNNDKVW